MSSNESSTRLPIEIVGMRFQIAGTVVHYSGVREVFLQGRTDTI